MAKQLYTHQFEGTLIETGWINSQFSLFVWNYHFSFHDSHYKTTETGNRMFIESGGS